MAVIRLASGVILDSQSVKTGEKGEEALVLVRQMQTDAAKHLLMQNITRFPRLKADGGRSQFVTWANRSAA
ncbi:MAG: hypothetical protein IPM16_20640 [Chloroflexi bacterium]|nr:hypothetical protein [Chloroflexota bacterium]